MIDDPGSPRVRPATPSLFTNVAFSTFFVGRIVSTSGIWIHNIVASVVAYEVSASAFVVGLVSVGQFGPQLVLAPLAGAMADRVDRRTQLIVGRCVVASGSAVLGTWIAITGVAGLPGAGPIVLASFIVGLGFVLIAPAQSALVPALVHPSRLARAVELNAIPPALSRAVGPAIGAALLARVGATAALSFAAGGAVLFAVIILPLKIQTRAAGPSRSRLKVGAGLRQVRSDLPSRAALVGIAAVGVGADPALTLTPALAAAFDGGAALVGTLVSAFGAGATSSFLVLPAARRRLGTRPIGPGGLLVVALASLGIATSPTPGLMALGFGAAGFGSTCALTSFTTQLQERTPDQLRGRVMALWSMAYVGSRPVAAAVNGLVSDATGPRIATLAVGVATAGASYTGFRSLRRHI